MLITVVLRGSRDGDVSLSVSGLTYYFSSDSNISGLFGLIGIQRMNPNNFVDPLSFHLVPPAGQSSHLSNEISQHLLNGLT